MNTTPPTVAITGATGFLGRHLTEAFLDAGHHVIAAVRSPDRARQQFGDTVEVRRADLGSRADLARAFADADIVIANAALGSRSGPDDAYVRTNIEGTENTVHAAVDAGVRRLVQVSTVAVYRARLFTLLDENAAWRDDVEGGADLSKLTTDPRYSRTKTSAERRARELADELGLDMVVVRPGPIYGSGDSRFTARLRRTVERGISLAPTAKLPLVHARDVADAIVAAAVVEGVVGRAYNLAGPPVSLYRATRALRRHAGGRALILPVWAPLWAGYDSSAAARDLGFTTRTVDDGMREVVDGEARLLVAQAD